MQEKEEATAMAPMAELNSKPYLSLDEGAHLIGVTVEYLRRAVRSGELAAFRLGHRTLRIRRDDLDAWVLSHADAGKEGSANE